MAQRILTKYPRSIFKGAKEIKQHFKHLLVIDFECTCKKYERIEPQEIIELPCAAVSTETWEIKNTFHEYIKPRHNPQLTVFCTQLTGIMQSMVDNQPYFPEVFQKFCEWLKENNYSNDENDSAFVTCGDWDLKFMLPRQCKLENVPLPAQFSKWINLKGSFCDATDFYPRHLVDMLSYFDLPLHGKLHSGINDVKNMISVIQELHSKYNFEFKINNMQGDVLRKSLKFN